MKFCWSSCLFILRWQRCFAKTFKVRATVIMGSVCFSPRSKKFHSLPYFVFIQKAEEAENAFAKYEAKIPSYQKKIQDIKVSLVNFFFDKNYVNNYGCYLTTLQLPCNNMGMQLGINSLQPGVAYLYPLVLSIPTVVKKSK